MVRREATRLPLLLCLKFCLLSCTHTPKMVSAMRKGGQTSVRGNWSLRKPPKELRCPGPGGNYDPKCWANLWMRSATAVSSHWQMTKRWQRDANPERGGSPGWNDLRRTLLREEARVQNANVHLLPFTAGTPRRGPDCQRLPHPGKQGGRAKGWGAKLFTMPFPFWIVWTVLPIQKGSK